MNQLSVIRYTFDPYYDGYFENGSWYDCHGHKLLIKYYNGRCCIDVGGKRFGIQKLRKFAKKIEVENNKLPF